MSPNEGQEEFEEVQSDLKKQEDEVKISFAYILNRHLHLYSRKKKMKPLNCSTKKLEVGDRPIPL